MEEKFWKSCNICKKGIPFNSTYYVCTVSTCRRKVMGLIFCSVLCWDGHLGFARHKDAACEEAQSPNT